MHRRCSAKALLLAGVFAAAAAGLAEERSELSRLLGSDAAAGFAKAVETRSFEFPQDHGPHPQYRNEWWYMTGNLFADNGRRFGFELTFFRFALTPALVDTASAWRTNQVYIAHFAVTDAGRERFHVAERFSRGALGLAGATAEPFRVWIDDWQIAASDTAGPRERWRLRAEDDEFALDIGLEAEKAPVRNGVDGLSQKSPEPGNASYYYSVTRWRTAGRLRVDDDEFAVSGLSWLDREWSSSALGRDQQGWDWFALQLSDGSELMFYGLRRLDGTEDPLSAGTWVAPDGQAMHLAREQVEIRVRERWTSPEGGTYPARWDIRVPDLGLELDVVPVMSDQELFTTVRYWEGAVDVGGSRDDRPISGRGYVELTGYAQAGKAN